MEAAHARSNKRRAARRQSAILQSVIERHEYAGDVARSHHLHEDAVQHYQDALSIEIITPTDQSRISEKLAYTLTLGNIPNAANSWFDRALASGLKNAAGAVKKVEILLQQARQLWIDSRTEAALPLIAQAIEIATSEGNARLRKLTNSWMADYLIGLSRWEEAISFINKVEEVHSDDGAVIRATYHTQKAMLAAAFGNASDAFEYFERAVSDAKLDPDIISVVNVWVTYGSWAGSLANIELDKACYEHGLLAAREHHAISQIPRLCLGHADSLLRMGQYKTAYEYLLEALSYNVQGSRLETSLAWIGIPLALHMEDAITLATCARTAVIDFAFRSGEPERIASTAAVFAQLYSAQGRQHEAQELLHRALHAIEREALVRVWIFPIAIARWGMLSDVARARNFLEKRAALPCSDLVQACLPLFDAFIAERNGNRFETQRQAHDAAERFAVLGWYGYVDIAYTLLPSAARKPSIVRDHVPFSNTLSVLTPREQQVAGFALKGFTNRAIADALSISENTVETHMASIMNRLGIRSRHQLVNALGETVR